MNTEKTNLLTEELDFYNQNKEDFIHQHTNRYLLIKGSELIGSFPTKDEAVGEGYRRFGAGPFLARLSGEDTAVASIPALTLGLL